MINLCGHLHLSQVPTIPNHFMWNCWDIKANIGLGISIIKLYHANDHGLGGILGIINIVISHKVTLKLWAARAIKLGIHGLATCIRPLTPYCGPSLPSSCTHSTPSPSLGPIIIFLLLFILPHYLSVALVILNCI